MSAGTILLLAVVLGLLYQYQAKQRGKRGGAPSPISLPRVPQEWKDWVKSRWPRVIRAVAIVVMAIFVAWLAVTILSTLVDWASVLGESAVEGAKPAPDGPKGESAWSTLHTLGGILLAFVLAVVVLGGWKSANKWRFGAGFLALVSLAALAVIVAAPHVPSGTVKDAGEFLSGNFSAAIAAILFLGFLIMWWVLGLGRKEKQLRTAQADEKEEEPLRAGIPERKWNFQTKRYVHLFLALVFGAVVVIAVMMRGGGIL